MKCSKLHGFLLFFLLSLCLFVPISNANTVPTMSTEQAQYIFDYFLNSGDYTHSITNNQYTTDAEAKTILQNASKSQFANLFNQKISTFTSGDVYWNNISIFLIKDIPSANYKGITFFFTISNNVYENNFDYLKLIDTTSTRYTTISNQNTNVYYFNINIRVNNNLYSSNITNMTNTNYISIYPKATPILNETETIITNMPFVLNINFPRNNLL